jgi:hypothetical protein
MEAEMRADDERLAAEYTQKRAEARAAHEEACLTFRCALVTRMVAATNDASPLHRADVIYGIGWCVVGDDSCDNLKSSRHPALRLTCNFIGAAPLGPEQD